jgi:DNA-binding transcriptional regulator YiaG
MAESDSTVTAEMVSKRRRRLGLSTREFGRALGVSAALVAKWEAGGKINDAHHRLLLLVMKMSAPALAKHERFKQLMRPLHSGGDPALAFLFLIGVIQ